MKKKKLFVSTRGQIRDKDEKVVMFGNGRKPVPKKKPHTWIVVSAAEY